jgi:hypothetical protein
VPLTVDEELNLLDDAMRRLKVEYDIFFGGGSKKPPADTEWRVQSLIKKFSDSGKLNYTQRFRYNSIAQKYAVLSDLWRKKLKIKEEGYSRPQDAMLGIQGIRTAEQHSAEKELESHATGRQNLTVVCSDIDQEPDKVQTLFKVMMDAKIKAGESAGNASVDSFKAFLKKKTDQLRKEYGCQAVEYSVETENGKVKLKAKATN